MTIKQHGGVFGRNPTFRDVEVEGNLTVGGGTISAVGSIASQSADSVNIDGGAVDGITLGTNSAVTEAQVDNINMNGNSITSTNTDGNIILTPNGDGLVGVNTATPNQKLTAVGGLSNHGGNFIHTGKALPESGDNVSTIFQVFHFDDPGDEPDPIASYVTIAQVNDAVVSFATSMVNFRMMLNMDNEDSYYDYGVFLELDVIMDQTSITTNEVRLTKFSAQATANFEYQVINSSGNLALQVRDATTDHRRVHAITQMMACGHFIEVNYPS